MMKLAKGSAPDSTNDFAMLVKDLALVNGVENVSTASSFGLTNSFVNDGARTPLTVKTFR
eukprot:2003414-Amphidinium_carterae.1